MTRPVHKGQPKPPPREHPTIASGHARLIFPLKRRQLPGPFGDIGIAAEAARNGSRFRQELFLAELMARFTSFGRIPNENRAAE